MIPLIIDIMEGAVICSNPAIISTAGMIEAPARPKEYYF